MNAETNIDFDKTSFCGTSSRKIKSFTLLELFNLAEQGNKEAEKLLEEKLSALNSKSKGNKSAG